MIKTVLLYVAVLIAPIGIASAQVIGQPAPVVESVKIGKPNHSKVIVRGCHGEDTCKAMFRRNSHWVIKRVEP